jgi:hypothetical protein
LRQGLAMQPWIASKLHNPPSSVFQVLGLQAYTIMPSYDFHFVIEKSEVYKGHRATQNS